VVPEFARAARHINRFRMLARITFFICFDFAILTSLGNGLQAEGLHHAPRRGLRHLVLEMPPLRILSPQRLQNHTARLLSTASSVPEYLCTVPEECLNAMLPRLEFDARFRDVLVGVSVQGQARAQGRLQTSFIPDGQCACIDLCLEGTIQMVGIGNTRGLQIHSIATNQFKAEKRMVLGNTHLHCLPAKCKSQTSMQIGRITNQRPQIMGRIIRRIAYRQMDLMTPQAKDECSEHIDQFVCACLDDHVQQIAESINASLQTHLQSLSADDKAKWANTRFCTNADFLFIGRGTNNRCALDRSSRGVRSIVVVMPRTRFGQNAGIGLLLLGQVNAPPVAREVEPIEAWPQIKLRPVLECNNDRLVVSLNVDSPGPIDFPGEQVSGGNGARLVR
jgi:hypothetical protein